MAEGLGAALERLDEQITKVVVIDDNPQDSRLIRRLLQTNKNYRVFEANNSLDGLDIVRQRRPDLVICDLTMPEMDGFTLLEQLKADPNTTHIPVMVLSGKSLTAAEKARLKGRIESVWTKGNFETRDLYKHVVTTLQDQPVSQIEKKDKRSLVIEQKPPTAPKFRKVLIVDDNPYDSRLVKRILEAEKKYEISEAHTGIDALKAIRQHHPDLVILDVVLPDMNGLDVLADIRRDDCICKTKVAILSAKDLSREDKKRLHNATYWPKAMLDRSRLVEVIEKQLEESAQETEQLTLQKGL